MMRIFRKADVDRSGMLSRSEFRNALKAAKLGLTRKDINLIMFKVDTNNDQEISYEEFVPVCFQVRKTGFPHSHSSHTGGKPEVTPARWNHGQLQKQPSRFI